LASLGVGLTWTPSTAFSARLTYGGALVPAPLAGPRDLQDEGVAFLVTLHPLEWVRGSR
jgi:hypothetical protein